jgi:hypothetical protein
LLKITIILKELSNLDCQFQRFLIYLSRCSEGALRDEYLSRNLIFEYSKTKPADITAYREFDDLWRETKEIESRHSLKEFSLPIELIPLR